LTKTLETKALSATLLAPAGLAGSRGRLGLTKTLHAKAISAFFAALAALGSRGRLG
jgi:hypothetical protein